MIPLIYLYEKKITSISFQKFLSEFQRDQQRSLSNPSSTRIRTDSKYESQGIEEGPSSLSSGSRSDLTQLTTKQALTKVELCSTDGSNNSISGTNEATGDATTKLIMQRYAIFMIEMCYNQFLSPFQLINFIPIVPT